MTIFDHPTYPWHLREAVELHGKLVQLYPSGKRAAFVAVRAGVPEFTINVDQAAVSVWKEILEEAWPRQLGRTLVQQVLADPSVAVAHSFFRDLGAGRQTDITTDVRDASGAPARKAAFITGSDDVTSDEANLFHDDLTMSTGKLPWLIGVLQRLQALAPSVFLLRVTFPGAVARGTAFRIGDDLLLTNCHMIELHGVAATKIVAEHDFQEDASGNGLATRTFTGTVVASHQDDDWAIIRIGEPLPATPILKLSEAAVPALEQPAFVIQHPNGERKRVGYVRNSITLVDARVIQYLTDTQVGSSGSPVLNDEGRLIGLHHRGGQPQEVAGQPPMKKNEGIRIEAILANVPAGLALP
jgi:S1-C subfamily serine protease